MTLQLLAVTLLRLNNSVRTLERIESLPCESTTDFFYVFTSPFLPIFHSLFYNTNYLLLFLEPQTKTGYKKDTSQLEVGKLFPWILSIAIAGVFITLARTDFISSSSQEKQIKRKYANDKNRIRKNAQAPIIFIKIITIFMKYR